MARLGLIDLARPPLTLAQSQIDLAEEYLFVPSGLGAHEPMRLTAEQVEVLWAWYAVTPNGRRFIHNRKLLVRMAKGWAKSPLGAVCMFAELVGDVVPDGLDANGQPVGRPHPNPWLQVAANSLDQTDNLYKQFYDMLKESPAIDDFHIDLGITRSMLPNGGLIEPVTSESGTREGQPISGAALEETQTYRVSNGGVAMAATIHRNATKMNARVIELYNAYVPGAGSVAQRSEEKIAKNRASGVLFVCRQGQKPKDADQVRDEVWVREQLEQVYGQAALSQGGWVDLERVTQDIVEAGDEELAQQLRFFFNIVTDPDESALDLTKWGQLANADLRLTKGDVIALGFDGSDSADSTALYACRWPDWAVFEIQVWERPLDEATGLKVKGEWRVNRAEVKARIRQTCLDMRVVRGYADDAGWQSEIDELNGEFDKGFMRFPHRRDERIGPACERWSTMIDEGTLRHDGGPTLAAHSANARKVHIGNAESKWWRPGRRIEGQPIDALSAAISAVHALGDAVAHGECEATVAPASASKPATPGNDRELYRPTHRLKI